MKYKYKKQELSLDKIKVARLSNSQTIVAGNLYVFGQVTKNVICNTTNCSTITSPIGLTDMND